MAQKKGRKHIIVVSDAVHKALYHLAGSGETTPSSVLETMLTEENMDKATFVLALLRGSYAATNKSP